MGETGQPIAGRTHVVRVRKTRDTKTPTGWNDNDEAHAMKKIVSDAKDEGAADAAARLIDARILALDDWRGETLSRIRTLIKQADPEVLEDVKWRGVPVWSHAGIVCTGETYKHAVKMTFARGAALEDPSGLFNASLDGNTRRAIDLHEGDTIDGTALKALFRAAVALNIAKQTAARPARRRKALDNV